jgi:hypothetical protein
MARKAGMKTPPTMLKMMMTALAVEVRLISIAVVEAAV